jgi:hypothetical protein
MFDRKLKDLLEVGRIFFRVSRTMCDLPTSSSAVFMMAGGEPQDKRADLISANFHEGYSNSTPILRVSRRLREALAGVINQGLHQDLVTRARWDIIAERGRHVSRESRP